MSHRLRAAVMVATIAALVVACTNPTAPPTRDCGVNAGTSTC